MIITTQNLLTPPVTRPAGLPHRQADGGMLINLHEIRGNRPRSGGSKRDGGVSLRVYHCNPPFRSKIMAKEQTDRTTLDLFADERRPGRPKTNPLSRDEQLRINKRNQLRRDKVNGLRRVELKLNADIVDALNQLAYEENVNRGELIEQILLDYLQRSDLCTKL